MKNTYCVIMAGGIGSRFWPLSTTHKPKQFLDILGIGRTLIQQTFDRFNKIMPAENIYVVSNEIYKDIILAQLPELTEDQILLEPAMRNTAPCIAYATYKILSRDPEANFVVAPSDHLILKEKEFLNTIKAGLKFTLKNNNLLTLGIKPSRPETGYGYIQINEATNSTPGAISKVKTFTEKPNKELAQIFFESGEFLWNSGIFIWRGDTIKKAFETYEKEIDATFEKGNQYYYTKEEGDFVSQVYPACKSISIDYGILEKAKNVYVMAADVGWSDLGTWGSLHEHLYKDEHNNGITRKNTQIYDSSDNIVNVQEGKVAVIQGLDGYIVVDTDKAIIICKKEEEQRIKQFVNDIKLEQGKSFV